MARLTILVTGSSAGIGRQTALDLARRGARVLLHARNRERGDPVLKDLRLGVGAGAGELELVTGDFESLAGVAELAAQVRAGTGHLDVLIHNAAVFRKERSLTRDGLETTFAVNHLAPFLLTRLLLEHLDAAGAARVITVSSMAHEGARLDFDNLQGERYYDGFSAYALSKLGNVLFTLELARRLEGSGITATCLHPGVVSTRLLSEGFGITGIPVTRCTPGLLRLALDPELAGVTGVYFRDGRPAQPAMVARQSGARDQFWSVSERLTARFRPDRRSVPPGC